MALVHVGEAFAAGATVTLPSHQAGDLIVVFANGIGPVPTLPSGWNSLTSGTVNGFDFAAGWKVAESSSETSGDWGLAEAVHAAIWRDDSGAYIIPGIGKSDPVSNSQTSYRVLTTTAGSPSSPSHFAISVIVDSTTTDLESATPSGFANAFSGQANGWELATHKTSSKVSSVSFASVTVTGGFTNIRTLQYELIETGITIASGGGGGSAGFTGIRGISSRLGT